jgi:hypothetical protein
VTVGWDGDRGTYFAQVEDPTSPAADAESGLVLWLGQDIGEVGTVEELERALVAYATVPVSRLSEVGFVSLKLDPLVRSHWSATAAQVGS